MKRILIKNAEGVVNWRGEEGINLEFGEADKWLAEGIANNWWGLPEREELDDLGEPTGNILPAEYTIEITDITAELAAQSAITYGKLAQSFGAEVIAYTHAINASKNLPSSDLIAIMQDSTLAMIERLLWNGSLVTAKELIATLPETYFTEEEITLVVTMIDNFLAANGRT